MSGRLRIVTLVENTEGHAGCIFEHGLSVYVETGRHRLLLDAGQSDAVLRNAEILEIDLAGVDTIVLSHGHYDHSGGIMPVAELAPSARIFMQRTAAEEYRHGDRYIGIDSRIARLPQTVMLDGNAKIDDELFIFSGITGRRCRPQSNIELSRKVGDSFEQDSFEHEQCLVITRPEGNVLLSGCAHNGILNILDRYREIFGGEPEIVISGFHMMKKTEYTPEEIVTITDTAKELAGMNTLFFTGHCTGLPAFDIMKDILGDRLRQLHSGCEVM